MQQAIVKQSLIITKLSRQQRQAICAGFILVVRLALGCLFIWSSLSKIRQPYDFLSDVYSYELVGPKLGMLTVMVLPWLELLVGICLVGGIFVSGALLASVAMAAMFTFVVSSVLYRGLEIGCGCFGNSTEFISYSTLTRVITILLFSVVAYIGVITMEPKTGGNLEKRDM